MASQFLNTFKYGLLAVAAFAGPRFITDSGNYLGRAHRAGTAVTEQPEPQSRTTRNRPGSRESGGTRVTTRRPLTYTQGESPSGGWARSSSAPGKEDIPSPPVSPVSSGTSGASLIGSGVPWHRSPVVSLEEAIRFDRTPEWIMGNWSRVDTVRGEAPLFGYRVTLITGPAQDDLTGVLTYYFDSVRLQKISFTGQTGDYRRILRYLESRFGVSPASGTSPSSMKYESVLLEPEGRSRTDCSLVIEPAQTFFADQRREFYEVSFTLPRP